MASDYYMVSVTVSNSFVVSVNVTPPVGVFYSINSTFVSVTVPHYLIVPVTV